MSTIEEYKAEWQRFLVEKYEPETLTDLCMKQFKYLYEEAPDFVNDKEGQVAEFLDKIFSLDRLLSLFCVISRYKKYNAEGLWELILAGKQFAPMPGEIRKPQYHTEVPAAAAEMPAHEVVPGAEDTRIRGNLKAIIIGVGQNFYRESNNSFSENDALAVKKFLQEHWGLDTDDDQKNICVLPGYVTGKEARKELTRICEEATEEDTILFYFSGYGLELNGTSYLMTSDSYIYDKTVRNALQLVYVNQKLAGSKAKIKIRLFDANYSGQRLDDLIPQTLQEQAPEKTIDWSGMTEAKTEAFLARIQKDILANGSGWATFTACDFAEKACESPELEHGIFTYYLLEALKGNARRGNNNMYLEDIKVYTSRKVMETLQAQNVLQTPQYQCELNGHILME
ncbi:MAG: caspase family protein [Clostridiales bacterium]|nr:caspase family protein [Candidatus Blautia equi]